MVLCQLGLQFVPDRPVTLVQMRRVLAPGGRPGLTVYGPIGHNPATLALAQALDRHLGRMRRGPVGLAFPQEAHVLVADR